MGKAISRFNRQMYRFNAENRAHRELEKDKLVPAPRHPSTERAMKQILEETAHIKDDLLKKDPVLDDYLKKIYVKSHDPIEEKKKKPSERSRLPEKTKRTEESELGYFEPSVIPEGKVTLLQALRFLADHQGDPQAHSATTISNSYKLKQEDVEDVLGFFTTFKIHIREDPSEKKLIMSVKRKEVEKKFLRLMGHEAEKEELPPHVPPLAGTQKPPDL